MHQRVRPHRALVVRTHALSQAARGSATWWTHPPMPPATGTPDRGPAHFTPATALSVASLPGNPHPVRGAEKADQAGSGVRVEGAPGAGPRKLRIGGGMGTGCRA